MSKKDKIIELMAVKDADHDLSWLKEALQAAAIEL
jgi:hypothetical protein